VRAYVESHNNIGGSTQYAIGQMESAAGTSQIKRQPSNISYACTKYGDIQKVQALTPYGATGG